MSVQLSRFREIGKKIVGLARTYRFVCLRTSAKSLIKRRGCQLICEGRGMITVRAQSSPGSLK